MKIYLIGSLRNEFIPRLGVELRACGFDVFDDWHGAGPEADDKWMEYEKLRGRHYKEALAGEAAQHVFHFDKKHLDLSDAAVLVMPGGKSAHLELGYMAGRGKSTYVLFDKEPDRYDVMYNFATAVCFNKEELINELQKIG